MDLKILLIALTYSLFGQFKTWTCNIERRYDCMFYTSQYFIEEIAETGNVPQRKQPYQAVKKLEEIGFKELYWPSVNGKLNIHVLDISFYVPTQFYGSSYVVLAVLQTSHKC